MTLLSKLDALPPLMYRVLARHKNGKPMKSEEIAALSGLDAVTVRRLSKRTTWARVSIGKASKFMVGCQINPFQLKYHLRYIRRMKTAESPRIFRSRTNAYYARLIAVAEKARKRP